MGREHGVCKGDKARRCSRPARPLGAGVAQHSSSSQRSQGPLRAPTWYPDETFTMDSSRIFGYLTDCLRTIFPQVALVLQKDYRDEMVDARARGRSKTRRKYPFEVLGVPTY
jgi:hypothetical protein